MRIKRLCLIALLMLAGLSSATHAGSRIWSSTNPTFIKGVINYCIWAVDVSWYNPPPWNGMLYNFLLYDPTMGLPVEQDQNHGLMFGLGVVGDRDSTDYTPQSATAMLYSAMRRHAYITYILSDDSEAGWPTQLYLGTGWNFTLSVATNQTY